MASVVAVKTTRSITLVTLLNFSIVILSPLLADYSVKLLHDLSYFLFALRDILIQAFVTIIQIRAQYIPLFLLESICLIVILEHQSEYFGYSLQPQCFFSFSEK